MATASKSYSKSSSAITHPMWPANLISAYDYLSIDITKFVPTADALATKPANTTNPSSVSSGSSILGGFSNIQSKMRGEGKGIVLLPVPDNLNYNDAPRWSESAVGAIGKGLASTVNGMLKGDADAAATQLQSMAEAGKTGLLIKKVSEITSALGMEGGGNAITQGLGGKIINPYIEQVFQGIGMRTFSFQWKLVPRSQQEQLRIQEIIKILRTNALPSYANGLTTDSTDGISDRWLEVPNIFNLKWKSPGAQELLSLPKIKPCVCTGVEVSYTPDNVWATHMISGKDPYPVAYNLTLNFSETEIITGKEVADQGF